MSYQHVSEAVAAAETTERVLRPPGPLCLEGVGRDRMDMGMPVGASSLQELER